MTPLRRGGCPRSPAPRLFASPERPAEPGVSVSPGAKADPGPVAGGVVCPRCVPGEFHQPMKNPQRLVPRGLLVRAPGRHLGGARP